MKNLFYTLLATGCFWASAQTGKDANAHLFQIYQHLHEHPELSLHEVKTSAYLCQELDALNLSYVHPMGGQGIAGLLENGEGPTILLRTDMDALPITEETQAAYKSKNEGVMHACGHDVHMSVWLGTLRYLATHKTEWRGRILFVAQGAEEIGNGSKMMLQDDLYKKLGRPDLCLALHTSADYPAGEIGICSGWFMANVDMLKITVHGRGGHGAAPNETVDPVVVAAKIIMNLQTIITRELKPTETAVITVGAIHGGTAGNIIPDKVEMELTVRSYSDASRQYILAAIARTMLATAQSAGVPENLKPEMEIRDMFTPALYNDPVLAQKAKVVLADLLGAKHVKDQDKLTVGEDFSSYGLVEPRIPVLMFSLGTVNPETWKTAQESGMPLPKLHSSGYLPDYEKAIPVGVEAMVGLIKNFSKE
jgi:hippurate hydrolase